MKRAAVILSLAATAVAACSKKEPEAPKITLEQLQASQGSTAQLGTNPALGKKPTPLPVGSVDNPTAARNLGLPLEASARTLAIEVPTPLSPEPDSETVNPLGVYAPGDKIRFRTRVTGFVLQQGEASFDFEWWIEDSNNRRIVADMKTVVARFVPDQGYSPVVGHKPAGLAGGNYVIHVKVTDNKAGFLVREAQFPIKYGVAPTATTTASLVIQNVNFTTGKGAAQVAGKPIAFDLTILGLLADATGSVSLDLNVALIGNGQRRALPLAHHAGRVTTEGTFPVTVQLEAVPAGSYTLDITAMDVSNEHSAHHEQAITVQ